MAVPLQTTEEPVIEPGVAGTVPKVTFNVCAVELPQVLLAVTETRPLVVVMAIMLIVFELPVQPLGNVQVYDVAPFTDAIEKVSAPPLHTLAEPAILPGVAGAPPNVTLMFEPIATSATVIGCNRYYTGT